MFASRRNRIAVPAWLWPIAAGGIGSLVGLESWAWMRHGVSAIHLIGTALVGVFSLGVMLLIVVAVAYGGMTGITGWDPAGWNSDTSESASPDRDGACDPNYEGACLDPAAGDYDCAGGTGDGPQYAGTVTVVGTDLYDLDRDGNGVGC
jgi:hypothetical protein